jgi:hypothetical protein
MDVQDDTDLVGSVAATLGRWWWLEFFDHGSLGVAIVRAPGVRSARAVARLGGYDPGGYLDALELDDDTVERYVPAEQRHRLLDHDAFPLRPILRDPADRLRSPR